MQTHFSEQYARQIVRGTRTPLRVDIPQGFSLSDEYTMPLSEPELWDIVTGRKSPFEFVCGGAK